MNRNLIKATFFIFIAIIISSLKSNIDVTWFFFVLFILLIYILVIVVRKLCISINMYSDLKTGVIHSVRAVIYKVSGHSVHDIYTTKKAYANYTLNQKKYDGIMICISNKKINAGNTFTIFISEKNPNYFAISKQHIKESLFTYLLLTIIIAVVLVCLTVIGVLYISDVDLIK